MRDGNLGTQSLVEATSRTYSNDLRMVRLRLMKKNKTFTKSAVEEEMFRKFQIRCWIQCTDINLDSKSNLAKPWSHWFLTLRG